MPYLIFALISVAGAGPVILGLIVVAVAPSRTEAVVAVLREGRSTGGGIQSLRHKSNCAPDSTTHRPSDRAARGMVQGSPTSGETSPDPERAR